jgi:LuxR family transcriptional regulator, quorum-sensing system regulator CciR
MEFVDLKAFVAAAQKVESTGELENLMGAITGELGFDHFAIVHHVVAKTAAAPMIRLTNYPESWAQAHTEREYVGDDPVVARCQKSAVGFVWSDLPRLVPLSARQVDILNEAQSHGLMDGYSVPINIPGEWSGSSSFALGPGRDVDHRCLPAAQYVSSFAFEAARRLLEQDFTTPDVADVVLTQRQFDCLVQIARGKTDWEAARILGLSRDTVHQHVETAKKRYRVATRSQLVVAALYKSALTFSDVLH